VLFIAEMEIRADSDTLSTFRKKIQYYENYYKWVIWKLNEIYKIMPKIYLYILVTSY